MDARRPRRVAEPAPNDATNEFLRPCLLTALKQRPVPGVAERLLPLLAPATPVALRNDVARVIGRAALDSTTEARRFALLGREDVKADAALALMLGGSSSAASRAFVRYLESGGAVEELFELWDESFGFWSRDDVANGTLFRQVENADAMAMLERRDLLQFRPRALLGARLEAARLDNGPHTVTRVVLNHQLRKVVSGADEGNAALALRTLVLLKEAGILLHMSKIPSPRAALAAAAYRDVSLPR